jgi:hypothetical protein
MVEPHRFEVGEKYENMKGVFEVIAIRKDSMDIRWEDGEEISTSIALQQRILERMQHENEMEEAQVTQQAKPAKPAAAGGTKLFSGLDDGDFGHGVSKTPWRGRGQLGGAVTRRIAAQPFHFLSWAVTGKSEIHWLDRERQKQADLALQAKFYAQVDKDGLCCGVHLPKPDPALSHLSDWNALTTWLAQPQNDAWLRQQTLSGGLVIRDRTLKGFAGTLEPRPDHWAHCGSGAADGVAVSLSAFLAAADAVSMDLRIEKRIDKATVIQQGPAIAATIAALFENLMPLYAAAATRDI